MSETRISLQNEGRAGPRDGTWWFRLVTPRLDDHGTVILPDGGRLDRHRANPLFLWMHRSGPKRIDPSTPGPEVAIGKVDDYDQTRSYLDILVSFDLGDEFSRRCFRKVRDGFIRSCSVGFDPIRVEQNVEASEADAPAWGVPAGERVTVIAEWDLLEASLVLIGSNQEALAILRALDPEPEERRGANLAEVAPAPVLPLPVKETFPAERKNPMAAKMKPEHRWIARSIIGSHMSTAEGHLRAMEFADDEGHRAFHKGSATSEMDAAERMAGQLRESHPEPDGDEFGRARRPSARTIPDNAGDADLRARFRKIADDVKALDVVDAAEVLRATIGTDDAEKADARISALQATQERYVALRDQVNTQREDAHSAERESVVTKLLDQRLMTPAQATRARAERWSLVKLGEFKAEAEKAGPVVEIVRQAPLRSAEERPAGSAPAAQGGGAAPLTPAAPAARERGEGGNGSAQVPDAVRSLAQRAGLNPDKVAERFERYRRGEFARPDGVEYV